MSLIDTTLRRLRYRRWPHSRYSNGYHHWQPTQVLKGRKVFECVRCGATVQCYPHTVTSPLLHKGERVVTE